MPSGPLDSRFVKSDDDRRELRLGAQRAMPRKTENGCCRLCGFNGKLTFEHLPPESAFNDVPVRVLQGMEIVAGNHDPRSGRKKQRGSGDYTLCEKCNNDTGSWYGSAYAHWALCGARALSLATAAPSLAFRYPGVYPLRILKQILCLFFSANGPGFREQHPALEYFVRTKHVTGPLKGVQLYTYLQRGPVARQTGLMAVGNFETGSTQMMSEISFPPFGYVMCFGSPPPEKRQVDIGCFATAKFEECRDDVFLHLPILETNTAFPGDYRSEAEIADCVARNRRYAAEQDVPLADGSRGRRQP